MKKILAILASLGITATASLSVVACGGKSTDYDKFMSYVDETKGSYSDDGQPIDKSSASVIYLGAKDNASSQSFEYALSETFGSLEKAKTILNRETNITKSNNFSFGNRTITDNVLQISISDFESIAPALVGSDLLKVTFDSGTFDGYLSPPSEDDTNYYVTIISDEKINITTTISLTGYKKVLPASNTGNIEKITTSWNTAYNQWLTSQNPDRSIEGIDLNLDTSSSEFGQVSSFNQSPVYGIKGSTTTGLLSNAYDYSKVNFTLKTLMVDNISDYWNSKLFNSLTNDYLKTDTMYQLTANSAPKIGKEDNYTKRSTKVDDYLKTIEDAKGPLFFIVKNGHVIKVMKGWNRYSQFSNNTPSDPITKDSDLVRDLISWTQEIGDIFTNSFIDNNHGLFGIDNETMDVNAWSFAKSDDQGKANWDSSTGLPTD